MRRELINYKEPRYTRQSVDRAKSLASNQVDVVRKNRVINKSMADFTSERCICLLLTLGLVCWPPGCAVD